MAEKKLKERRVPAGAKPLERKPAPDAPVANAGREGDRVWVSISRKIQLAKFDMLEVGIGSSVTILPGETEAEALRRIGDVVRAEHADLMEVVREDSDV